MRYFKGACAFLVGTCVSLFFRGPRVSSLMLPQIGILGATLCMFFGTLRLNGKNKVPSDKDGANGKK